MSANDRQVGGNHYASASGNQHWDIVVEHQLNYFEGQITKYVMRARKKNGKQDLEKARHFLEKYLEVWDHIHPIIIQTGLEGAKPLGPAMTEMHSDEIWQCEGYYGDGTQLYRHRVGRQLYRAKNLQEASEMHLGALNGASPGPGYTNQG